MKNSINDDYTVALLHMNGMDGSTAFTDESGKTWTAYGNAQMDIEQQKFGAASLLLDGNDDYITTPHHSDFDISGDFTFDFWVRFDSAISGSIFLMKGDANDGWRFYMSSATALKFTNRSAGVNTVQMTSSFAPVVGQWYHLALTRSGNSFRMFADGVQLGGVYSDTDPLKNTTFDLRVGAAAESGHPIHGWMDEVRFSNGIARWTSNFTPPTSEY
jgi:hypothetical protein